MAEELTQRHTGDFVPSAAHHRASSQDDTPLPKKQPRRSTIKSSQRRVRTLANVLCLLVGLWYVWTTHDLLGFILLYAIATGVINAREVVGKMLPERRRGEVFGDTHSDDNDKSEQDNEPQS